MVNTLEHDILRTGSWQADDVKLLENLVAVINELITDHALILANLTALYVKFDAASGTLATDFVTVLGASGSTAALPATLTNATALKLTKG